MADSKKNKKPEVNKKRPPQPGLPQFKSETKTVVIAPSDYEHIYSAKKAQPQVARKVDLRGQALPLKAVKSDTPTVQIAPSDYEHLYDATKDKAQDFPSPKKIDLRGQTVPVKAVKSDTPTVQIAPSDYQHIFDSTKQAVIPKRAVDLRGQAPPVKVAKSDTTVQIAPSDYQHIFDSTKQAAIPKRAVDLRGQALPVKVAKSDTTVQIAPSDYEHIFDAAKEATMPKRAVDLRGQALPTKVPPTKQTKSPASPKSPTPKAKPHKSATDTIYIAPNDYEHIYDATKDEEVVIPRQKIDTRGTPIRESSRAPPEQVAPTDYVPVYEPRKDDTQAKPQVREPMPDPGRRQSLRETVGQPSGSVPRAPSRRRRSSMARVKSMPPEGPFIDPDKYAEVFNKEPAQQAYQPPPTSPTTPTSGQASFRAAPSPEYDDTSRRAQPLRRAGEEGISREVLKYVVDFINSQPPEYHVRRERRRSALGRE